MKTNFLLPNIGHLIRPFLLACTARLHATALLLGLVFFGSATLLSAVDFSNATNFATNRGAYSVAVGDFNGDGKPDLAVANANSNNVSILLGIPALTISSLLTVSATSSDQVLVPNANIVLGGSGESRTVTIKAAANESGPVTITLSVTDGKLTATDSFVLTVTPAKPQNFAVKLSAKSRALADGKFSRPFGRVQTTNKKGTVRTITITNAGKTPLSGLKITKDGVAARDFIVLGYSRKPLAPGKSTTISLVFKPKGTGERQAAIRIFSSEALDNPFDLTLGGTGYGKQM